MFQVTPPAQRDKAKFSPGLKLWVSLNGKGVFGKGKWLLLDAVKREGSLQAAARTLGISYRKAWGDLREMENGLGIAVLQHHRGGPEGGSSTLTDTGVLWWREYGLFLEEMEAANTEAFSKWLERMRRPIR